MKFVKKSLPLALALTLLNVAGASARTTVTTGVLTNLQPTGAVVSIKLSGYPTNSGFYIIECLKPHDNSRPELCNPASQLWISTSAGANFLPTADIQFRPTANFNYGSTSVDCLKAQCGIFIRLDHMASAERSEDQFLPISFVGGPTPNATQDVIRLLINGKVVDREESFTLRFHDTIRLDATSKSGVAVTYATTSPGCTLTGNQLYVTKGSGTCDIAITSPGNAQYSATTAHYIFRVRPGIQKINVNTDVRAGTSYTLPATTNFNEKVLYSASQSTNCSLNGNVVTFNKSGACLVRAIANGLSDNYSSLKQTISFKIR